MVVLLIVLAALLILSGVFLFTPQEFGIEIIKTDKKGATYICLRFLGIPIKFPIKSDGKSKKAKTEKKEFSFSTFKEKVLSLKEVYDSSKDELKKTLSFARRELTVKNVDFRIHFGLDNAAATGISTGAVWGVGSILLKIIDSLIGIKKINMKVDPDFDNKVFEIYSKIILIIKPIKLIIIVGQVIKMVEFVNNKTKGGA